jgi:hypothetical protein
MQGGRPVRARGRHVAGRNTKATDRAAQRACRIHEVSTLRVDLGCLCDCIGTAEKDRLPRDPFRVNPIATWLRKALPGHHDRFRPRRSRAPASASVNKRSLQRLVARAFAAIGIVSGGTSTAVRRGSTSGQSGPSTIAFVSTRRRRAYAASTSSSASEINARREAVTDAGTDRRLGLRPRHRPPFRRCPPTRATGIGSRGRAYASLRE